MSEPATKGPLTLATRVSIVRCVPLVYRTYRQRAITTQPQAASLKRRPAKTATVSAMSE